MLFGYMCVASITVLISLQYPVIVVQETEIE